MLHCGKIFLIFLFVNKLLAQQDGAPGGDTDYGGGTQEDPAAGFSNDTVLYEDEMKEIKIASENISNTISYLDVMVKNIIKASTTNTDHIDLQRQADQVSRIPLKVVLNWMRSLCDNVLQEAKESYGRVADFRESINGQAANPLYIQDIRDQLKKYEQRLGKNVKDLESYKMQLGTLERDQAITGEIVTEGKFPESKYHFLDKLYGPTQDSTAATVQDNATSAIENSENFRNRLINILKYYKVYVPTEAEESMAPEGMKPSKDKTDADDNNNNTPYDNDENFSYGGDHSLLGEKAYASPANNDGHNPMPVNYPDHDTQTDSDTMKELVSQGLVQIHESVVGSQPTPPVEVNPNNDAVPPTVQVTTTTIKVITIHDVTTAISDVFSTAADDGEETTESDGKTDDPESCTFDTKLIVMIVLLSMTPFLIVAFCLYFSFCRNNKKVQTCTAREGGNPNNENNYDDVNKTTSSVKDHVKITMLPQK